MPRGRGGQNNRTDLPGKVPVMTAPDQTYGKETAQAQSQKILPLTAPTMPGGGGPGSPAAPAAGGGGAPPPSFPAPGPTGADQGGLGAPPQTPAPATQGLPSGPGAGPEVAGPLMKQAIAMRASEQGTLQSLLSHLASQPGASSITKSLASAAGIRTS